MHPTKRASPWVWALLNQLAFPGLGTILGGRKVGYAQAAVMVAGFLLAMGFMGWFLVCVFRYAAHPGWTEADFRALYRPYRWALFWGFGLCALAWVWSLFSSVAMLRSPKGAV
jgi:hypothetical protein